jgi:chromosome segregation ATPase
LSNEASRREAEFKEQAASASNELRALTAKLQSSQQEISIMTDTIKSLEQEREEAEKKVAEMASKKV